MNELGSLIKDTVESVLKRHKKVDNLWLVVHSFKPNKQLLTHNQKLMHKTAN